MKKYSACLLSLLLILAGCSKAENTPAVSTPESTAEAESPAVTEKTETAVSAVMPDTENMFTERDLAQTADLSGAEQITVSDNQEIMIAQAGVYLLTGSAKETTVIVDAGDEDKVQIVLNGVSITNTDTPCIYVKNADKVFVTTTDTENSLSVTSEFREDGTETDGVIFAKDDLVLNGTGSLTLRSSDNAVVCKDILKITGGTYIITADDAAFEANDAILVYDGNITVLACEDGLHAENDEDDSTGYIYIRDGLITISGEDDAVHGTTLVQIDGGDISLTAAEGIEATYILINGGELSISASGDGLNAGRKSSAYIPVIEITGGYITITMGQGDCDAVDANGNIYMSGGTLEISAESAFDYDGEAEYTGGTIIVNGTEINTITRR
ncbi:MAG: carbohydrate-binding domain-containing protein [Solobacterium sp.]|nr:carbohydrate-binding domain-containing protein [Solobacterium sp.]